MRSAFCKDQAFGVPKDFTAEEIDLLCFFRDDDISQSLLPAAPRITAAAPTTAAVGAAAVGAGEPRSAGKSTRDYLPEILKHIDKSLLVGVMDADMYTTIKPPVIDTGGKALDPKSSKEIVVNTHDDLAATYPTVEPLPDISPPRSHTDYPEYLARMDLLLAKLRKEREKDDGRRAIELDTQIDIVEKKIREHVSYITNAIAPPTVNAKGRYSAVRLAPSDGSPCGEGFVREKLRGIVQDIPNSVATVVWNNVELNADVSYCLPYALVDDIRNNRSCDWRLGSRVITYRAETGTIEYTCMCKYPELFGGPSCNRQVACAYEEDGLIKYRQFYDRVKGDYLNHEQLVNRGIETDGGLYALHPTDKYPRFVCDCRSSRQIMTANIHPLVCLPDPCYPASPFDVSGTRITSGFGLATDSDQCNCEPGYLKFGGRTTCMPKEVALRAPFTGAGRKNAEQVRIQREGSTKFSMYRFSNMDANTGNMIGPVTYYGIPKYDSDMTRVCFERVPLQCDRCAAIKMAMQKATGMVSLPDTPQSRSLVASEANVVLASTEDICSANALHQGECVVHRDADATCKKNVHSQSKVFQIISKYKGESLNNPEEVYKELTGEAAYRCAPGHSIIFNVNQTVCAPSSPSLKYMPAVFEPKFLMTMAGGMSSR